MSHIYSGSQSFMKGVKVLAVPGITSNQKTSWEVFWDFQAKDFLRRTYFEHAHFESLVVDFLRRTYVDFFDFFLLLILSYFYFLIFFFTFWLFEKDLRWARPLRVPCSWWWWSVPCAPPCGQRSSGSPWQCPCGLRSQGFRQRGLPPAN